MATVTVTRKPKVSYLMIAESYSHVGGKPYLNTSRFSTSRGVPLQPWDVAEAARSLDKYLNQESGYKAFESEFNHLVLQWKRDCEFKSSIHEIVMHAAYQRIIGFGKLAVPFIIRELQREPSDWFWALQAITGKDPVPESERGDVYKMADAWIAWAKRHGFI